ncbi:MAG: cyclophilin-like family protein [Promethearchaeota archaeon]
MLDIALMGRDSAFFFGPTPASKDEKPRAASPVNIFAKIEGDAKIFHQLKKNKK